MNQSILQASNVSDNLFEWETSGNTRSFFMFQSY